MKNCKECGSGYVNHREFQNNQLVSISEPDNFPSELVNPSKYNPVRQLTSVKKHTVFYCESCGYKHYESNQLGVNQ